MKVRKVSEEIDWQLIKKYWPLIVKEMIKEKMWEKLQISKEGFYCWLIIATETIEKRAQEEFWRRLPEEKRKEIEEKRREILARLLEEFKQVVKLEEIDVTKLHEMVRELQKLHATRGTESSAQSSEAGGQV